MGLAKAGGSRYGRRRSTMATRSAFISAFVTTLALSATAWAGPGELTIDVEPAITGGQTAQTCAWPTTVAVTTGGGLCSGTLVHPEVVVYAAHCGASSQTRVNMGESAFGAAVTLVPEFCQINPGYGGVQDPGNDWAFCKLNGAVDIPVTPPLMGCELDTLVFDREVAIAGFGDGGPSGNAGVKRWAMTTTRGINPSMNIGVAGGMGNPAACQGDSGGPAFVRLDDGGWRAWGIVSTGTDCGAEVNYALISGAVPWIEQQSGVDITPCHDADGTWNPTATCGGFNASEPGAAFGSWSNGCVGGTVSELSDTCGPFHGAPPDTTPPTVSIVEPLDQATFDAPASVDIRINAADEGWGIDHVAILVDGVEVASDPSPPYEFLGASFADEGVYELVAVARDYAGLETLSEAVNIGVGDVMPPPSETTGSSTSGEESGEAGSGAEGEAGTGEEGLGADEDGDNSGCACDAGGQGRGGAPLMALFGLGLLATTRRRSR